MKLTKKQIENRRKWADALQTSEKCTSALVDITPSRYTYCCLGVYANRVCNISNSELAYYGILRLVEKYTRHANIRETAGIDIEGENMFVHMNDTLDMSHVDIGLYLYLTCEAGEAFGEE